MNHPFVHQSHALYNPRPWSSQLSNRLGLSWYHNLCVQVTLILLHTSPKRMSSGVGSLDMPKRSHKMRPLGEKVWIGKKMLPIGEEVWKVYIGFSTYYPWFQGPAGSLGTYPREEYCISNYLLNIFSWVGPRPLKFSMSKIIHQFMASHAFSCSSVPVSADAQYFVNPITQCRSLDIIFNYSPPYISVIKSHGFD